MFDLFVGKRAQSVVHYWQQNGSHECIQNGARRIQDGRRATEGVGDSSFAWLRGGV